MRFEYAEGTIDVKNREKYKQEVMALQRLAGYDGLEGEFGLEWFGQAEENVKKELRENKDYSVSTKANMLRSLCKYMTEIGRAHV